MCRMLAYVGPEIPLESLLLRSSNSLIKQSKAPEHHPLLQLAGWGFGAWSERFVCPEKPLVYRRPVAAFFDDNVERLIPSLSAHTALAHIRASTYKSEAVIADENCHPFSYLETPWIVVHNGSLPHWRSLQRELLSHCQERFLKQMKGTTDTEFLYVLFCSLLKEDSTSGFQQALEKMLQLILAAMKKLDLVAPTKLKLAFADAHRVVAVNFGSGYSGETDIAGDWRELRESEVGSKEFILSTILEPLYLMRGKNFQKYEETYDIEDCPESEATTAILASEPLTGQKSHWYEVEFGKMISVERRDEKLDCGVCELSL